MGYRDILTHRANRMSQSRIASACGCARSTVQDVLERAGGKGVSWDDVAGVGEAAAYEPAKGRPRARASFSLDELDEAIMGNLADPNPRPFQKKAGSRDERFEGAERAVLQPLPVRPFEVARWGSPVKVPKSYHVLLTQDGVYCSVPRRLANRYVEMRWTASEAEVFCDGERAASHVRDRSLPRG